MTATPEVNDDFEVYRALLESATGRTKDLADVEQLEELANR